MSQTLYKYTSINCKKNLIRFLKLIDGEAYFSSPNNFNDPFELSPSISPPTDEEILKNVSLARFENLAKPQLREILAMSRRQVEADNSSLSTEEWLNNFGIFCVTEDPVNLLMWAHYGNSHQGVCIGFDSNASLLKGAQKLNYQKIRPRLPFNANIEPSKICLKSIFLTKSKDWSYEKEWRVIKRTLRDDEKEFYKKQFELNPDSADSIVEILESEGGPGKYRFPSQEIRNIYFGYKVCEKNKRIILNFIKKSELRIKIFQLRLDPKYYMLTREEIKL